MAGGKLYPSLLAAGLFLSWLSLIGYAYNVEALYAVSSLLGMSRPTAATFLVLFVAALLARPANGWMKYFTGEDSGGIAARFLLPAIVVVPFALAGLMVYADRLFGIGAGFGFAIVAVTTTAALAVMVCLVSAWLLRAESALKQVNEILADNEAAARTIIETAHDAVIQMDDAGKVLEWNPQAETVFGWRREEALGKKLSSLVVPEETRSLHESGLARFLLTGKSNILNKRIEITAATRSGKEITVELTVTAQRRKQGYVFNAFARDLTAKIAIESQLRQAQKMEAVGQLTGGVAHDFNNLLAVIIGSLDGLDDMLKGKPRAKILAGMALKAALRGADLTRQLLVFSRRQTLQPTSFDLNERVAATMELLKRTIGGAIDIKFLPGPDLWPVVADPTQLEAALTNLSINARDAMLKGGSLIIETANKSLGKQYQAENPDVTPGDYVMLVVSDTGTGMQREILDRVFEPFFTTKDEGKGTGLGLSMVYGFAKQSHGHVKIYSEPGHGTAVRLYLPRSKDAAVLPASEQPLEADKSSPPATILVVEDNSDVRAVAVRQLTELGYKVVEAPSGKAALDILKEDGHHIDLLFTDVVMPGGMTGDILASEARATRPGLKVLFTSGFPQATAMQGGGQAVEIVQGSMLSKPYRKYELARRVRETLSS
jgi:PAS domain S-box-containing protein